VIDLGRRSRVFTGVSREAVMLLALLCHWPGCNIPVERCDADHTKPWAARGRTDTTNGRPLCHRHNLLKEHGYRVVRDVEGDWHYYDPDGAKIR
jgi:hypothetical protein